MTDKDVVAKVAELWGVRVHCYERKDCKPAYICSLRGRAAAELMLGLRPVMGKRRREQIDTATSKWKDGRELKVTPEQLAEIKRLHAAGIGHVEVGRRIGGLSGEYIRSLVRPNRGTKAVAFNPLVVPQLFGARAGYFNQLSIVCKQHWLVGYLEGEAYFRTATKGSPQISCTSTDRDISERVAGLLGSSVRECPAKEEHWSSTFTVDTSGLRAIAFMQMIEPWMGVRRRQRITEILREISKRH